MVWKTGAVALTCVLGACAPAAAPPARAAPAIELELVLDGLSQPLFLTHAGDGSGRLFVVEQTGRIRILGRDAGLDPTFLDLTDQVETGSERGLLGLAFHPDFAANGRFFVNYTRAPDGASVVAEFHAGASAEHADPQERVLLTVAQPFANHNGGMVAFGPDGYLYIGLGDGGSAGDPGDRAQNPNSCSEYCGSTSTAQGPTGSRRTTRSPAAAAAGDLRLDCAIPGASRSIGRTGGCWSATSARTGSRRSTSSAAAATTAGR